jgi:hypothetical protein
MLNNNIKYDEHIREAKTRHVMQSAARANARKHYKSEGTAAQVRAVSMAEKGYGFEDITKSTGVSRELARLLVLGV